jgi:hypothetical protein
MIVHNLDILCAAVAPNETDPPLGVDADRMLSLSIPDKSLQPVSRWRPQVGKRTRTVKQEQFAPCLTLNGSEPGNILIRKKARRRRVFEGADHSEGVFSSTE